MERSGQYKMYVLFSLLSLRWPQVIVCNDGGCYQSHNLTFCQKVSFVSSLKCENKGCCFLVFCEEKCGLQSLKEPLDEGNQRRKEKSRCISSDNYTNTGSLGTVNGKHFRKHLKICHGNFPSWPSHCPLHPLLE